MWRYWSFYLLHEEFIAAAGLGATRNGSPIQSSGVVEIESEFLVASCTQTTRSYRIAPPLKLRNLGSAAYHLAKVADGTLLASVELNPKIWDVAGLRGYDMRSR